MATSRVEGGGGGGGGEGVGVWHVLVWPKRTGATEQGFVFRVLDLRQGLQFHYLAS